MGRELTGMRILLRHVRTGHYYNGGMEWVSGVGDASDFGSVDRARELVTQDKLDGMSLVLKEEEGGREEVLDLTDGVPAS